MYSENNQMKAKVLNFGSLNIDHVYGVREFVRAGETISSVSYSRNIGGKGLNQSIALARAGLSVHHAGKIGSDGLFLVDFLKRNGVNTEQIAVDEGESGHAVIQVNEKGQNCIILNGGANRRIGQREIDETLSHFGKGDFLVLQNEINRIDYLIDAAYKRGMKIAFNVAPVTDDIIKYDFSKVSILNVNETEGAALTGKTGVDEILLSLAKKYPECMILLTLGKQGCVCFKQGRIYRQSIYDAPVVDTTSAGDTFFGYFLSEYLKSESIEKALDLGSRASAVCVSRAGASASIPMLEELPKTSEEKQWK